MTLTAEHTGARPFSEALRAATWASHEQAAAVPALAQLMAGELPRARYADMVAQHWFAYSVLEDAALVMAQDTAAGSFVHAGLERLPALEADLAFLLGEEWPLRVRSSAATRAYCDRMTEVCFTWPGGFVAHHYTRYLGDLSGGQHLGRALARMYGLADGRGVEFYRFDAVPDPKAFKAGYRRALDDAPWDPAEQRRIVAEISRAYELNTQVLAELG